MPSARPKAPLDVWRREKAAAIPRVPQTSRPLATLHSTIPMRSVRRVPVGQSSCPAAGSSSAGVCYSRVSIPGFFHVVPITVTGAHLVARLSRFRPAPTSAEWDPAVAYQQAAMAWQAIANGIDRPTAAAVRLRAARCRATAWRLRSRL
jgi:hypothetical protein